MWSSISTLATFSLAISSASGSTSTEVTELCNRILLLSLWTFACLLAPGVATHLAPIMTEAMLRIAHPQPRSRMSRSSMSSKEVAAV